MKHFSRLFIMALALTVPALGQDVVRLGATKVAHYGAIFYMREIAPKYNLKIELKLYLYSADSYRLIKEGELDGTASTTDSAIIARTNGLPIYIVAGFCQGGIRIIGRSDLDLKKVADLKGKKVGVIRAGAQELTLFAELDQHNLTWSNEPGKDVLIVYLNNPSELNLALSTKDFDAISQTEPYASAAIANNFGREIIKPYDTPLGNPIRSLVLSEQFYKERPDVAARLLKCLVEATKTFIEQPQIAEKYVRDVVFNRHLSHESYMEAVGNSSFTYDQTVEHVQTTTDYMIRFGLLSTPNPIPANRYVKLDLLKAAKQELGVK